MFCILGTALTFIFVTFLVHFRATAQGDYPPSTNAGRIITLSTFQDMQGNYAGSLSENERKLLLEQLGEYEDFAVYSLGDNLTGAAIDENYFTTDVNFVTAGFWNLYDFEFIAGRPFTEKECTDRKKCVIITENLSKSRFHTINSIGRTIEMSRERYQVIGVVNNFSLLVSPTTATEMWFPYEFNNSWSSPALSILFSPQTNMQQVKAKTVELVRKLYKTKNKEINISVENLLTDKENNQKNVNGDDSIGFSLLVFLFLLIPAMNIISLNMANTRNRAEEISVRRTYGADRMSSFSMLLFENLLLSLAGVVLGVVSAKPFVSLIQNTFFGDIPMFTGSSLMPDVDMFLVVTAIIPLMILFLIMFGGLPAWLTAKRNISDTLKGGIR
ncbi:MAG: ABC transporter permease [Dysgonamonadaceae bacterium]|nr:ABC transporter permease [Dysgonamonadaceae bacterium]